MQELPLRNARDWVDRSGLGGVEPELGIKGFQLGQVSAAVVELVPVQKTSLGAGSLIVGLLAGWFIGKQLLK